MHLLYHQCARIQKILLSQAYIVCWGETGRSAAVSLAVRQLEGCIGADSAASYVEFPGRRASRHTHHVELHSWPASSRPVAVSPRL